MKRTGVIIPRHPSIDAPLARAERALTLIAVFLASFTFTTTVQNLY